VTLLLLLLAAAVAVELSVRDVAESQPLALPRYGGELHVKTAAAAAAAATVDNAERA
jgi:hypothetical protein